MNKDRRRGGWVSTLLALVVLVVAGFLLGALAGFLWEEPSLVVAYLSGKTEPVEWSEPGPVAAEPPPLEDGGDGEPPGARDAGAADDASSERPPLRALTEFAPEAAAAVAPKPATAAPVKATPPKREAAAAPAKLAPAAPKPAAKPAAAAPARVASAPGERFSVQVGAFSDSAKADELVARLRARGYTSYVKAADGSWRVRVGPVDGRARAEDLAAKLQQREKLPTWILGEES